LTERVKISRNPKAEHDEVENGISEAEADTLNVGENCEGVKRFRTLMVTNVPPDSEYFVQWLSGSSWDASVRDEQTLRDYFDYYLHRYRARYSNLPMSKEMPRLSRETARTPMSLAASHHSLNWIWSLLKTHGEPKSINIGQPPLQMNGKPNRVDDDTHAEDGGSMDEDAPESDVDEVILVRKLAAMSGLRDRRQTVLRQLEVVKSQYLRLPILIDTFERHM